MSVTLPVLRQPTRYERLVFAITKRWPDSYVAARLWHDNAMSSALARMETWEALETIDALMDQAGVAT